MNNNPEDYLIKNLKEELREISLDSLDSDLVLEILKIAENNSLDDDAKKRQDSIRALIKNLVKKNE